jgi:hypothetical protein
MTRDDRINYLNIGLMLFSCAAAFVMPFEVFLFAYAVMGPLHYLTEISWLHDRQYFTKGKYDFLVLLIIGVVLAFWDAAINYGWWPFNNDENRQMANDWNLYEKLLFIAFFSGIIVAFVKSHFLKIIGIAVVFFLSLRIYGQLYTDRLTDGKGEGTMTMLLTSFVPTLIHVYVFTGFFMLFGALKSRSKSGLWSVVAFVVCPLLLYFLFQDKIFVPVTEYGMDAYGRKPNDEGFFGLNLRIAQNFFGTQFPQMTDSTGQLLFYTNGEPALNYSSAPSVIFNSSAGILIMRFIAFAYMYHYLNWFSKTEIIRWHKVPKARFIAVIVIWVISLALYAYNYKVGLQWLFFLSFTHVLLEFPLNFHSMAGIAKETRSILSHGFTKPTTAK